MKTKSLLFTVGFFVGFSDIADAQFAETPPNIVFILTDDLGWTDLSCYGNKFNETPQIDKLAETGIRFTQAYASCPVCSPTRASIMTGKYPARLQLTNYIKGERKDENSPVLPANWKPYLEGSETTLPRTAENQRLRHRDGGQMAPR